MIDPKFRNINWLFVLSFKKYDNDPTRNSYLMYYKPFTEIKDFNALTDTKPFSDQCKKSNQEVSEKLAQIPENDDYTTENLLKYMHHQTHLQINWYRFINPDKYDYFPKN